MRKPARLVAVAALLCAVVAIAASENIRTQTWDNTHRFIGTPALVLGGELAGLGGQTIYVDGGVAVNSISLTGGTALAHSARGITTYDFPELGQGAAVLTCAESWAATATGAAIGDGCVASSNFGADAGSLLPAEVQLSCSVSAAGAVKFKLCALFMDGGTYNATDGGFFARTFR